MSMQATVRVVVGHEPQFYRELLAAALQLLLPDIAVTLVEPTDLDEAFVPGDAAVVICSALTETVAQQALAWVLLYPDGENLAVIGIAGRQRSIPEVELNDLLAVIAEAQGLFLRGVKEGEDHLDALNLEPL